MTTTNEPITPQAVAKIIERERPDALLPTLGGQTGLNTAVTVAENGVLEKFNVEMIGASVKSIRKAEDREEFAEAMERSGLNVPHGGFAGTVDEAMVIADDTGFTTAVKNGSAADDDVVRGYARG